MILKKQKFFISRPVILCQEIRIGTQQQEHIIHNWDTYDEYDSNVLPILNFNRFRRILVDKEDDIRSLKHTLR